MSWGRRVRGVPRVPWWGVASSAAAPVLLIGGWTLAAARQRGGFDPAVETISALAALDADDRWLMTAALAGVGCCHLVTAAALRPAAPVGRALLAAGGVGTVLVAVSPLPVGDGGSAPHTAAAALAFGALAAWPALALRRTTTPDGRLPHATDIPPAGAATGRGPDATDDATDAPSARRTTDAPSDRRTTAGDAAGVPVALRPAVAGTAAVTLLGLVGWFVAELARDGDAVGFTERLAAASQSLWPLVTVLSARRLRSATARPPRD